MEEHHFTRYGLIRTLSLDYIQGSAVSDKLLVCTELPEDTTLLEHLTAAGVSDPLHFADWPSWCNWLSHQGTLNNLIHYNAPGSAEVVFTSDATVLSCFQKLSAHMRRRPASDVQGLHTCLLSMQTDDLTEDWPSLLKLYLSLWKISRDVMRALPIFYTMILFLGNRILSAQEVNEVLYYLSMEEPSPISLKYQIYGYKPYNKRWMRFRLQWPERRPPYNSDLDRYTWQPWCAKPTDEHVQLFLFHAREGYPSSILISATTTFAVVGIKTLRSRAPYRARMPLEHQCNNLLAAVLRYIQNEMTHFTTTMGKELKTLASDAKLKVGYCSDPTNTEPCRKFGVGRILLVAKYIIFFIFEIWLKKHKTILNQIDNKHRSSEKRPDY